MFFFFFQKRLIMETANTRVIKHRRGGFRSAGRHEVLMTKRIAIIATSIFFVYHYLPN